MKITLLYVILGLLLLFSIGCLILGIYYFDMMIIATGVLLLSASGLLYLEVKKLRLTPLKKAEAHASAFFLNPLYWLQRDYAVFHGR